jgi:hypothetical protein
MRMSYGAALKIAEVALGLTLLYFRFCLYETEEGQLENVLVAFWLRISDYASSTRTRLERLLQETGRISQGLLDSVFGSKLVSLRAIGVSGLLILASLDVFQVGSEAMEHQEGPGVGHPFTAVVVIGGLILTALAPVIFPRRWAARVPIAAFLTIVGLVVWAAWVSHSRSRSPDTAAFEDTLGWGTTIFAALVVDFLWVLTVRLGTGWALRYPGIWRHAIVIAVSAAVSLGVLLVVPYSARDNYLLDRTFGSSIATSIDFVAASRIFVAIVSAVQLAVLLVAFAHWFIWPLLSRVVYAADRYQFFRERKFFGTIGVVLIAHASAGTWVADTIQTLWAKK